MCRLGESTQMGHCAHIYLVIQIDENTLCLYSLLISSILNERDTVMQSYI